MQTFSNEDDTYDVEMLWKLAPKTQFVMVNKLSNGMDEHIWGDKEPTPNEVLRLQKGYHWDTCLKSDLRYAILVTPTGWIADGNHRLIKAIITGKKKIRVRQFSSFEDMKLARIE